MPKKALGKGLGAIFGDDAFIRPQKKQAGYADGVEQAGTVVINAGGEAADKAETGGYGSRENQPAVNQFGQKTDPISVSTAVGTDLAGLKTRRNAADEDVSRETVKLRVSLIEPNRNQPRKQFQEESLQELADSMKKYGVLQPLLVRPNGSMYELIAGERRWRAAKLAGLKEVPVLVRSFAPQESAEIAIIENIQRENLGPVEEARAYQALIDEYGLTQEEVAERVSKNRSTITNSLRLLQLSDPVLDMLTDGRLSAGHARCLITLGEKALQEKLAEEIVEKKLSVRETEKLVKHFAAQKKKKKPEAEEQPLDMYLIDIARKLTASLNTKVLIKQGSKGRGKIEIDYYSNEDLEKIISRLR